MTLVLSYPGGQLKTVTIAATAGNVVTGLSPGTRKRWKVLYGIFTLACDATVANRKVQFDVTDGTNRILYLGESPTFTASQTKTGIMAQREDSGTSFTVSDVIAAGELWIPDDLIIEGDDEFQITISNGLAGDSYSGFIRVLELGL